MPGCAATGNNPDHATCYDHIGQHSACLIAVMQDTHKQAYTYEYADLLSELEQIGYEVRVISLDHIDSDTYRIQRVIELSKVAL